MGKIGKIRDAAVILNICYMVILSVSIWKFPSMITGGNSSAVILSLIMYSAYGVTAFFLTRFSLKNGFETAIIYGTITGMMAGFILAIKFADEHLVSQVNQNPEFLPAVLLVVTFLLYWAASFVTMVKTRNLSASIFSGVWSSMTASIVIVAATYSFLFAAPVRLQDHYFLHFQSSGMENISAFVIHALAAEGSINMLTAPVVAVIFAATAVIVIQISDKLKKQ